MSIRFDESTKAFTLETKTGCYQMKVDELGYLQHLYYGPKVGQTNMSYAFRTYDHGFSGNPYDMRLNRAYSLDSMAQEYTSFGVGDFRVTSIRASFADGSRCAEFRYESHEILDGKYAIPGLPSVYDNGEEVASQDMVSLETSGAGGILSYIGIADEDRFEFFVLLAALLFAVYKIANRKNSKARRRRERRKRRRERIRRDSDLNQFKK